MEIYRFLWLDDTDPDMAEARLESIKAKLDSWDWNTWNETSYESQDEAYRDLSVQMLTPSMFGPGKIITCRGTPKCQAKIAKELNKIPERIMLVIISRPDTKTTLYKKAKELEAAKLAEVEKPLVLKGREAAAKWLTEKAASAGLELDKVACQMIVEFVGNSPSRLSMELKKIGHMCEGGRIFPWAVEKACHGSGTADVRQMCDYLAQGDYEMAHEYMGRLLSRGEPPIKICGYLTDWVRKLAMADSCQGNYQSIKGQVEKITKFKKPDKDARKKLDGLRMKLEGAASPAAAKKVMAEVKRAKKLLEGESTPMFPNPGALYYSCKTYNEIGSKKYWAYWMLQRLGRIQMDLRGMVGARGVPTTDDARIMHGFIAEFQQLISKGAQDGEEGDRDND